MVRFSRSIFFFAIALAIAGIFLAFRIPLAVFPQTNFPRVVIGVDNGVTPIEQMEVTVTRPIEDAVNSVPGLATVDSITSRGSAEIDLFFNWNVDMVQTLQLVDAAVARVQQTLPPTAQVSTHRLTFASFPILGYSLTSKTVSQTQLWELATYSLKPPLNRLPGVSTVVVQGGQVPEYHIVPNTAKMEAASLTVTDIVNAIDAANIVQSPGLYTQNHELILGLVGSQAHNLEQLSQIAVKASPAGVPIRLADVAAVQPGTEPLYSIVTANGQPAVLLNISRQPDSNTVTVTDEADAEMAQLRKVLPPDVQVNTFYDQSHLVRESVGSVRDAILLGLVLAALILILFLRDWTASLVAGLVIPITIFVTFILLWALGESFDLMTLGGLAAAVGLVIDDAIVVVENIALHREHGESRVDAVRLALKELTKPLLGSTITPIVVFLPLVAVTGVVGIFFRALALTMTVALLTSLALALTWTPALSMALLRRKHAPAQAESTSRLMTPVLRLHERILRIGLQRPLWLAAGCCLLLAGMYFTYQSLGSDLLPEMDEGAFVLDYVMPAGSSLAETDRVLEHVDRILHSIPEVTTTSRRTGLQLGLAAVTEANTGDYTVMLTDHRSRGIDDVMEEARQKIRAAEPELDIEFTQVMQDMIGDLSNAPEPIQIKLYSTDENLLQSLGPRIGDAISKVPGVVDVENGVDNTISGPATNFVVDPGVAARLGFTPAEVATDATSILDGIPSPDPLINNGRPYTVRVRLDDSHRTSLDAIENTVFVSSTGKLASLGSLAHVQELPPQNELLRENLQQMITVTGRLEGSDLGTAIKRVQQTVQDLHLPPGVRVSYGGTYQTQQQSFHQLLLVLVMALVLVFGVLLVEFQNFYAPASILISSILSTFGVLVALLITGTTFNVASFMGLIMVIGIVAKNGILLLDADERFRAAGLSARDAMMQAAQRRLRPIVMTALAAMTGMLPLAFGLGAGSQMLQPLAIAVIGGLLISMVLSLVVTPAAYFLMTRD
ncbi:MAG TPA: efflux RND transporter permease subunit [Acidobacteriaceae bacterium]|jgi:CzcA family heavy metal efflux pump|nr:efflux RND transporter permease subunit [Acidobacteriaceae bacterium]